MTLSGLDPVFAGLLLATLAGLSVPLGATLARLEHLKSRQLDIEVQHTVMAFGGGALFSAIALVLVPEAADRTPGAIVIACFMAGGVVFLVVDRALARRGGKAAQFLAMMLDYLPEAMALGALVTADPAAALLTAVLMALQNLPEGFGAWREMTDDHRAGKRHLFLLFALMVPLGPAAAAVGLFVLDDKPAILGATMAFAAGGILYILFQDVAPGAHQDRAYRPAFGAVLGFGLGLAGHLMLG